MIKLLRILFRQDRVTIGDWEWNAESLMNAFHPFFFKDSPDNKEKKSFSLEEKSKISKKPCSLYEIHKGKIPRFFICFKSLCSHLGFWAFLALHQHHLSRIQDGEGGLTGRFDPEQRWGVRTVVSHLGSCYADAASLMPRWAPALPLDCVQALWQSWAWTLTCY